MHVLVRPRAGGFDYSSAERTLVVEDARLAIDAGAAGVVVGGTVDGHVDRELVADVRKAVGSAEVTFHRAMDAIADRATALETLIVLGVTRVLTSGGAPSAADAVGELQRMVEQAEGRIQIMAGGGVTAENAGRVAAAGVDAVHASARRVVTLSEGAAVQAGVSHLDVTDEDQVRRLREALADVSGPREEEAAWPRQ